MLAKNRSLNEIYYKLLLNSPQMITMDIPLKIGKGNISQTKIKHGVILADWKMCYESDMNVQGPVSNEYIQIIFCLNDGISWGMTGNYRSVSIQKMNLVFILAMEEQNTFAIKRIANIHLRVLKFLLHILGIFLRNILKNVKLQFMRRNC